jgi:choline dehydrogenase-like flavoprotein
MQAPRIDPNDLADESGRAISVAMIRKIRELVAQPAMQAYVGAETSPTAGAQTDEQILDWRDSDPACRKPVTEAMRT